VVPPTNHPDISLSLPSTSPQTTLLLSTSPLPSPAASSSAESSLAESSHSQKTILPQSQSPLASVLLEPILNPTTVPI
jgi:hypothetical protein